MTATTGLWGESLSTERFSPTAFDAMHVVADNIDGVVAAGAATNRLSDLLFTRFSAAPNQTLFTGPDLNGRPLFVPGPLAQIYVDGRRLTQTEDYLVEAEGTRVRFTAPLFAGAEVLISSFAFGLGGELYFDPRLSPENLTQIGIDIEAAHALLATGHNAVRAELTGMVTAASGHAATASSQAGLAQTRSADAAAQVVLAAEQATLAGIHAQAAQTSADAVLVSIGDLTDTVFPTRAGLAAAVATLPQGHTILVEGQPYVIDSTATGVDSALSDLGVNGVRRADRLENLFLAAHFTTQDDTTIHISVSLDGVTFRSLNSGTLPGGAAFDLSNRDPAITWFDGWWWIFVTGGNPGTHDFALYRSRDLTSWSKYQVAMADGPYFSNTVPMPGGTSPASAIWAPEPFVENGVMKVMISIRYGADFTNVYGAVQQHFRPYVTTLTNANLITFSAPVAMTFGPAYPANVVQWNQATGTDIAPTLPLRHQSSTAGNGGFDMSLMAHLARAYPNDTILLVPVAKGGSGFTGSDQEHSFLPGGDARVEMAARINAAIAAHPGATIEGMFWQQGEQDRSNAQYQADLTAFMSYVRTTWTALATRPIILGEMGTFATPGTTNVNSVIAAVAATQSNYGVASSAGLTDNGDALHFDAHSLRTLGDRHFAAWGALRGTLPGGSGATRIFIIGGQSNAIGTTAADTTYVSGTSKIDPSVVKHGSRYYAAIKDSVYRKIQIYSATALTGPYTYSQTLTGGTMEIEAPCLTRIRDRAAINSETRRDKFRVYVDNNRTGVGDPEPNTLVGAPYYFETTGDPGAAYGPMQRAYFDTPVRHGSIVNLADLPQEAAASVATVGAAAGLARPAAMAQVPLVAGTTWIRPQPDVTYYTDLSIGHVNLRIKDGPADRFYLACFSGNADVGITVLTEFAIGRGFILGYGYGDNDAIIEMRRRGAGGGYYPAGMVRRSAFRANRGGTAQTLSAETETRVNFPTQEFDLGAYYDGTTSSYTPPRGRVDLTARVLISGLEAGQNNFAAIRKNGALVASTYFQGTGQASAVVVLNGEPCSGTDTFEVVARSNGSTAKSISGSTYVTEFSGVSW